MRKPHYGSLVSDPMYHPIKYFQYQPSDHEIENWSVWCQHIIRLLIKIMSVLKISTYIITSITTCLYQTLAIMYFLIFTAAVILYKLVVFVTVLKHFDTCCIVCQLYISNINPENIYAQKNLFSSNCDLTKW